MKKYILILLSAGFLVSCKQEIIKQEVQLQALRASYIYNADSVYNYYQKYGEANAEIAKGYFEKGISEKENNPEKALYYFRRSVTLYPTTKTYKELGSLLERAGKHNEAKDLYYLLSFPETRYISQNEALNLFIFDQPDENTLFGYLINSYLVNHYFPYEVIYQAKSQGIDVKKLEERILADERFEMNTSSIEFKNLKFAFMSEEEEEAYKSSDSNFKDLLSSINNKNSEYSIETNIATFKYRNGMNWELEESSLPYYHSLYLQEKQENSEIWLDYNFNFLHQKNDSINVVVYAIDSSATACPVEMRHIYHRLVTYDPHGNIIDSKIVAYQSGEEYCTMIYSNGDISMKLQKRTWKNPYQKKEFDNEIVNTEVIDEEFYRVNESGKIETVEENPI
jgi:hypothetical protein